LVAGGRLRGGLDLLAGAGLVFDPTGSLNVLGSVVIADSFEMEPEA